MKRKILVLGLVMVVLSVGVVGVILADSKQLRDVFDGVILAEWEELSTVYTADPTTVSKPEAMDIWIEESAKPPEQAFTRQPFTVLVTINNTNSASLKVYVMLNITAQHEITHSVDVEVWSYGGFSWNGGENIDAYTIKYYIPDVLVAPGVNTNATGLTVQYNTVGSYTITVAVLQP